MSERSIACSSSCLDELFRHQRQVFRLGLKLNRRDSLPVLEVSVGKFGMAVEVVLEGFSGCALLEDSWDRRSILLSLSRSKERHDDSVGFVFDDLWRVLHVEFPSYVPAWQHVQFISSKPAEWRITPLGESSFFRAKPQPSRATNGPCVQSVGCFGSSEWNFDGIF